MPGDNSQSPDPHQQTLLGIDYGEKNIGLAFGRNGLVSPAKIVNGTNDETATHEISRYAWENKVDKIIMGLPLSPEGKDTAQARKVRKFAKLLRIKIKKPVDFVNEYRSTLDAKTETFNLGISKKRRQTVDHLSAALILRAYYSNL